ACRPGTHPTPDAATAAAAGARECRKLGRSPVASGDHPEGAAAATNPAGSSRTGTPAAAAATATRRWSATAAAGAPAAAGAAAAAAAGATPARRIDSPGNPGTAGRG